MGSKKQSKKPAAKTMKEKKAAKKIKKEGQSSYKAWPADLPVMDVSQPHQNSVYYYR